MLEPFDCYSPGSRRLYHFEFHEEQHLLTAEARRTLDAIAAAMPARIASGRSTKSEAEAVAFLWLAIVHDLELQERIGPLAPGEDTVLARLERLRAANGIAWKDKVAALRKEIGRRRAAYPGDVDKGRLTRDQAKLQLEALEAVHDLYWRHGYAFDGTRDELRCLSDAMLDSAQFTTPAEAAA